jgi:hypothetical protein
MATVYFIIDGERVRPPELDGVIEDDVQAQVLQGNARYYESALTGVACPDHDEEPDVILDLGARDPGVIDQINIRGCCEELVAATWGALKEDDPHQAASGSNGAA